MWISIEPLDVLMFRDSRPFTGGESHHARCIFPPLPLAFQGAVRSKYLADKGIDFNTYKGGKAPERVYKLIGEPGKSDSYGKLTIKGPFLFQKGKKEVYFTLPRDILEPSVMRPAKVLEEVKTDYKSFKEFYPLLGGQGEVKDYFMTIDGLLSYLEGKEKLDEEKDVAKREDIYDREQRTGIKLGTHRIAEIGMFYIAEFIRLKENIGFLLEVEPEEVIVKEEGVLQLGGESRAVYYRRCKEDGLEELVSEKKTEKIKEKIMKNGKFKIYLATPAIFETGNHKAGWIPHFIDKNSLYCKDSEEIDRKRFKLVSAAVGKPLGIGGWDLARGCPKPMLKAVPAGSVYFFEFEDKVDEATVDRLLEKYHFECISSRDAQIGLGLSFVGVWDYYK